MESEDVDVIEDFEATGDHTARVLDLSTAHYNPVIDEKVLRDLSMLDSKVGYLMYAGGEKQPSLTAGRRDASIGLKRIMKTARKAGYDYVLFDRDAPVHPDLPTFDNAWEKVQALNISKDEVHT